MTLLVRAPFLLMIVALTLLADHIAAGGERRLHTIPLDAAKQGDARRSTRFVRPAIWLTALIALGMAFTHRWPGVVMAAALLHLLNIAVLLHLGARITARSARPPAAHKLGIPLTVSHHDPQAGFLRLLSPVLQLLHWGVIAIGALIFHWLLPHLPSVARIGQSAVAGAEGTGLFHSPTKLWWSLMIPAFNVAILLLVAWGVAQESWPSAESTATGDTPNPANEAEEEATLSVETTTSVDSQTFLSPQALLAYRRAVLARFVEVLLTGMSVAAVVMWIGASFGLAAGIRGGTTSRIALLVAAFVIVLLFYCLLRYLPPLVRIRKALEAAPRMALDPSDYKLGVLYFSRENPALFVPKKLGYGSTLNFARPAAWVLLALLVGAPLAFAWYMP